MYRGKIMCRNAGRRHVKMKVEISQDDASPSQGMLKGASKTTESGRQAWNRFYLVAFRSNQLYQHFDLTSSLQNGETINFCCLYHQVCGTS